MFTDPLVRLMFGSEMIQTQVKVTLEPAMMPCGMFNVALLPVKLPPQSVNKYANSVTIQPLTSIDRHL